MANWTALQEKLIDKPVFKRAKHGIHFKQADGSILAHFSGKPCHYQDTDGLWKPIDTKPVLRKDGWYGCPHSDVVIHPDGTVKVGEYTQRAALISASDGKIDGDRIARPFSGGVQYLYITENGFRQEIVLEKMPDLKQVSTLLDTVSGVLPSKYTASALSAKDSTTAELADSVSLDSKTLASYLEKAKYPVVIDPDFTIATGVGADNYLRSTATSNNYGTADDIRVGADGAYAGVMRFDLSSVSGETTSAATLVLTFETDETSDTYNIYKITDANGDWAETDCSWRYKSETSNTAWAGSAGLSTAGTDYIDTVIATVTAAGTANNTLSIVFNSSGYAVLDDWFGDATNNGFKLVATGSDLRYLQSKDDLTEAYRPVLSITYSAAAAGNPWNYYAQM